MDQVLVGAVEVLRVKIHILEVKLQNNSFGTFRNAIFQTISHCIRGIKVVQKTPILISVVLEKTSEYSLNGSIVERRLITIYNAVLAIGEVAVEVFDLKGLADVLYLQMTIVNLGTVATTKIRKRPKAHSRVRRISSVHRPSK